MLLEIKNQMKDLVPLEYKNVSTSLGQNEKNLEEALSRNIGDVLFPEYLVFGNERSFQREADIFAMDEHGNLIVFELKVAGEYDRGKIYQALEYSQRFSNWQYKDMNEHYKKCFPSSQELKQAFNDHFGFELDTSKYNQNQKIIIISNGSSIQTKSVSEYWKNKGIEIEEYFYRIYEIQGKQYFELSNELYVSRSYGPCWINTCERYIEGAYIDMINNSKASAYGDTAYQINDALRGSMIFLYHNGYGIIGAGIGTAQIRKIKKKEEKYISLKEFIHGVNLHTNEIEKSITPSEIKSMLKQDFWFAKTKVTLRDEQAKILFEECKKRFSHITASNST